MKHLAAALSLAVAAGAIGAHAQTSANLEHGRLFPPENLGLLEGPDRAVWQKPDQIMDALGIADGSKVADIGAGAGWFTTRLARRVGPNGVVYSTDVQREMLDVIRRRVAREGLQNVRLLQGGDSSLGLPTAGALDAVLAVDVYPEVKDRVTEYMQAGQLGNYASANIAVDQNVTLTVGTGTASGSLVTVDYPFSFVVLNPVAKLVAPTSKLGKGVITLTTSAEMRNEMQ